MLTRPSSGRRCRLSGGRPVVSAAGFTLVELLVVMGIIALLIGILLPSLARAKEMSVRIKCMANMRQIVMASMMYVNASKGYVPFANWAGKESATAKYPYQAGWLYKSAPFGFNIGDPKSVKTGIVYSYLKSTDVFHCPWDMGPYPTGSVRNMTSYLMNGEMCSTGNSDVPMSYKVTKFRAGSVMYLETREDPGYWNDGSNWPSEGIPNRHSKAGSIGSVDGSVEWTPQSLIADADKSANRPNRFYCDPRNGQWKWNK